MTFLFVAGVEGAGHNMIRALLADAFAQPTVMAQRDWQPHLVNYWNMQTRFQDEFGFWKRKTRPAIQCTLHKLIDRYQDQGITHLFDDVSFPYDQPRNAIRRPDLLDFADLLPEGVKLQVLVLYRNPVSATYSGLRRGFTRNVYEQARIVEDNLLYIDKQVTVGLQGNFRSLVFEDFLKAPQTYLPGLAEWLELPLEWLEKGIPNLRRPFAPEDIPVRIRETLSDFFSPLRTRMWEGLYAPENQIPKS